MLIKRSLGIAAAAVLAVVGGLTLGSPAAQAYWHGRGWHGDWHGGWGWHGGHWGCCWRGGVFIGIAPPPVYVPPPVYYAPPPAYYAPPPAYYPTPYGY